MVLTIYRPWEKHYSSGKSALVACTVSN